MTWTKLVLRSGLAAVVSMLLISAVPTQAGTVANCGAGKGKLCKTDCKSWCEGGRTCCDQWYYYYIIE